MTTDVIEVKSKSRSGIVWALLALVIAFLIYQNIEVLKPAADQAYSSLKAATSTGTAPEALVATPVPVPVLPAATLDKARAAFTKGDFQGALLAYKEYIAIDSANLDARGELGNVYYVSGNYQEAAQTYYDLSKMLIDQRQLDPVSALLPVIGQVNPGLADELVQKMSQIQQPSFEFQPVQQMPGQS